MALLSYLILCSMSLGGAFAFTHRSSFTILDLPSFLQSSHTGNFRYQTSFHAVQSDDNEDEDELLNANVGPEKSRMTDFIVDYLGKTSEGSEEDNAFVSNDDDNDDSVVDLSTHLVAIPMDYCHELLIELESVQRAILYHCPILVHACIVPAVTRLPLLYVQAPDRNTQRVTSILADLVKGVAQKHIFDAKRSSEEIDDEESALPGLNADGIRPLTLTFQSLESDGSNNSVLSTVALADDEGTKVLQALVTDLKEAIEAKGWKTDFPPDPHVTAEDSLCFRPRVPFMRLPQDFDDKLTELKDPSTEIEEEEFQFLTSDQGGNGISPIFWCQWWDDTFGTNIRLRDIGIYPRQRPQDQTDANDLFYFPHEMISLPKGDAAMTNSELRFQNYQDQRLEEERERQSQPGNGEWGTLQDPNENPDILLTKTRERLENLYISSADKEDRIDQDIETTNAIPEEDTALGSNVNEETIDDEMDDATLNESSKQSPTASPDDYIDDWTTQRIQRIRNTVESREIVKSQTPVKKDKPPIEENPVFQKYKDGTLVPKSMKSSSTKVQREMEPYPSRDHFIGIWRVVSSPTGFPTEEDSDDKSENLILRADGTTAGGPILDKESNQKAAGGTWKVLIDEDNDVRLRIRLVIPPKKERILVMEGDVTRMAMGMNIPMASKAFGIPELEAMAKQDETEMEDLLHSGGEVYLEDAVTGKNRDMIGSFSLMKIQSPKDPKEYTITIPRPIRNQD